MNAYEKKYKYILALLLIGIMTILPPLSSLSAAQIPDEILEKEQRSRYYINYAGYLIDVGKYLEALESYEAAEELTTIANTKVDALLAKATLLFSFLDAPEQALKIYQNIYKNYPDAAEIAHYRKGMLLFHLNRLEETKSTLVAYLEAFPSGRFRYQTETLLKEISKDASSAGTQTASTAKPPSGQPTSANEVAPKKPDAPAPSPHSTNAREVALIPTVVDPPKTKTTEPENKDTQSKSKGAAAPKTNKGKKAGDKVQDTKKPVKPVAAPPKTGNTKKGGTNGSASAIPVVAVKPPLTIAPPIPIVGGGGAGQKKASKDAAKPPKAQAPKTDSAKATASGDKSGLPATQVAAKDGKHPTVRVRMCKTSRKARIEGKSICVDAMGCKDSYVLSLKKGKIHIDGAPAKSDNLAFKSEHPMRVINGKKKKKVRGILKARIHKGKLMVINVVDIEDYLLSVVPSENPAGWPVETLKAQAVAARTYAYYQRQHRKSWAYDLVDYAGDQAYGGMEKEHKRSTKAVRATTGEILTHKGKPILAMYSANSGGYTADAKAIFNLHKPYLVARKDPASLKGGMANWTRKFKVSKVIKELGKMKINAKGLKKIEAHQRGPSGRIVKVRLVMKNGKKKVLRNRTTLRRALDLPEILHKIELKGDTFVFKGHGWGHGVGYSQWGSAHLGKTKKYKEILAFYYGSARMKKVW